MKKFWKRRKPKNGLGAKIRGFRGAQGERRRFKLGSLRLDSGLESVVWTEKGKETWPQNAQKGAKEVGKEAGKVGTAEEGREGQEVAGEERAGRGHEKSRIR